MNDIQNEWGRQEWNEAHFPEDQLNSVGDTWGFRWRGMEKWRHRRCLETIAPLIEAPEPLDILDIGCALCDFTEKVANRNPRNQISGMDTARNAISWAEKRFPEFDLRVGSIPNIPFTDNFDLVLCMEVLCYLDSNGRKDTILRIHDLLSDDGKLVFSGVLDGGVLHHTPEELFELLDGFFRIDEVVYNSWSAYRQWIEEPLDNSEAKLSTIAEKLEMSVDDFASWSANKQGPQLWFPKAFRVIGPLGKWLVSKSIKATKAIRSWEFLPALLHRTTGNRSKGADEIVIVATKK